MIKKITLWEKEIQKNNCDSFERLNIFLQDNKKNLSNFTEPETQMGHHLNALKIRIREYFPLLEKTLDPSIEIIIISDDDIRQMLAKKYMVSLLSDHSVLYEYKNIMQYYGIISWYTMRTR